MVDHFLSMATSRRAVIFGQFLLWTLLLFAIGTSSSGSFSRHDLVIWVLGVGGLIVSYMVLGRSQHALHNSQNHLAATLRSIGDGVVSTDAQGNVTGLNGVAERLSGWTSQEAAGRPVTEVLNLIHTTSRTPLENPIYQALTLGRVVDMPDDTALIARDGKERLVADSCAPIRDGTGRLIGAVLVFRDVTEEGRLRREMRDSERRFRSIFLNSPDAYLLIRDGVIVDCNTATQTMLGCDRQQIVGQLPQAISPRFQPDGKTSSEGAAQHINAALANGNTRFEWVHKRFDGTEFWVDVSLSTITLDGVEQLMVIWRDISERKRNELELHKLSRAIDQCPVSVMITDTRGAIEYVNPAFTQTTGYELEEMRGQNPRILKSGLTPPEVYAEMWGEITAGREWRGELQSRRKNGELYWELTVMSSLRDAYGKTTHFLTVKEDITDRKAMEDQLRSAARTDRLTGLPNRALLIERLQQAVLRSKRVLNYRYALLFLDFDRFKSINDSLGHEYGDMLLQEIAQRMRMAIRNSNAMKLLSRNHLAARLGGDEFVVLLDGATWDDATEVAKLLLHELSVPYKLGGQEIYTTASIGITTSDVPCSGADDVLRDADTAMYEAKLAGKSQYVTFDVAMRQRVQKRIHIENDLRRIFDGEDQLFLLYQPILCLATGKIESYEALVRWQHPVRGLISPAEFIPIAEETGLILPIGEWVLRQACRQFKQWHQIMGAAAPPSISVNLSRNQLVLPSLPGTISDILRETGVEPGCLHLEVTESAVMRDVDQGTRMLGAIKDIGVKLDMDDFGTGHSSLACLRQFPFDVLKIDRSFVASIERGRDFTALVHAVTQLAQNLDIRVVAEGIETRDQLLLLQSLDCDFGQGYYFSKPLLADQVVAFHMAPRALPAQAA